MASSVGDSVSTDYEYEELLSRSGHSSSVEGDSRRATVARSLCDLWKDVRFFVENHSFVSGFLIGMTAVHVVPFAIKLGDCGAKVMMGGGVLIFAVSCVAALALFYFSLNSNTQNGQGEKKHLDKLCLIR